MKLALFDFDNTLFETPYNEDPIYMDRPQSLSTSKWKFKPNPTRPITNFTESNDMWLLEFCPIEWVIDRIREQYSLALGENI